MLPAPGINRCKSLDLYKAYLIYEYITCDKRCSETDLTNFSIQDENDDTVIISTLKDQKADLV